MKGYDVNKEIFKTLSLITPYSYKEIESNYHGSIDDLVFYMGVATNLNIDLYDATRIIKYVEDELGNVEITFRNGDEKEYKILENGAVEL